MVIHQSKIINGNLSYFAEIFNQPIKRASIFFKKINLNYYLKSRDSTSEDYKIS